ncbi:peroxiredoxin [Sulfolobales archaeon HS-7]|nr:peroxiredoxin [Sulfolobales archaeon HS-7]
MRVSTFTVEGQYNNEHVKVLMKDNEVDVGTVGSDYLSPEELLLASALSCLILTIRYFAKLHGVNIKSIEGYIEGDIDMSSMESLGEYTGMKEIRYHIKVESDHKNVPDILNLAAQKCPMKNTIEKGVKTKIEWIIKNENP